MPPLITCAQHNFRNCGICYHEGQEGAAVVAYNLDSHRLGLMMIDPTNKQEFSEFAAETWKAKLPNLRRVIELWYAYLETAVPEADVKKDPASQLIVALLAHHMGAADSGTLRQAAEIIRATRN